MTSLDELDPAEKGQGSLCETVSPAQLSLWSKCPLAFRCEYLDGIRTPVAPAMFLGRIVHLTLAEFYREIQTGIVPSWGEVFDYLEQSWASQLEIEPSPFSSVEEEGELFDQACGLLRAYLQRSTSDEPRPIAVCETMSVPVADLTTGEELGIRLSGSVDLLLGPESNPRIIDFKTSARGGAINQPMHELALSCLAYLVRISHECTESGLEIRKLIKTKTPKIEVYRWPARERRHFQRLFSIVRAYLDNLDSGHFIMRPGFGCPSCQYKTHCDAWCG